MPPPSSGFKSEPVKKLASKALLVSFTLVSYLAYSSTLKMEATCSFEVTFYFQPTTWRYIPEDNHRCENLKSYPFQECVFIRPVQSKDYMLGSYNITHIPLKERNVSRPKN
jgi:hypothetical protein